MRCVLAGIETAITRTPLATTLILANLSGHTGVIVPCLASALVSLFVTLHQPFIKTQQDRSDIQLKASPLLSHTFTGWPVLQECGVNRCLAEMPKRLT